MSEQNGKTSKFLILIFFLPITILGLLLGKYLIDRIENKKIANSSAIESGEFDSIESEIYQTSSAQTNKGNQALNKSAILLKQQLQISELQNNFYELKTEVDRIKTGDALGKIILHFVKLQDLIAAKKDYRQELRNLELLCRSDFALSKKIEKLRQNLLTPSKTNAELVKEFALIYPQLKSKKIEIESKGSWIGRIKAYIAQFITIKKTGSQRKTSFEIILDDLQKNIESKEYLKAINNIENLGPEYQEVLAKLKADLKNTNDFQQASDDIYRYLEMLSN